MLYRWEVWLFLTCVLVCLSSSLSGLRGSFQRTTPVLSCLTNRHRISLMTVSWEPHVLKVRQMVCISVSNCHCLCPRGGERRGRERYHHTGDAETSVSADPWQIQEEKEGEFLIRQTQWTKWSQPKPEWLLVYCVSEARRVNLLF